MPFFIPVAIGIAVAGVRCCGCGLALPSKRGQTRKSGSAKVLAKNLLSKGNTGEGNRTTSPLNVPSGNNNRKPKSGASVRNRKKVSSLQHSILMTKLPNASESDLSAQKRQSASPRRNRKRRVNFPRMTGKHSSRRWIQPSLRLPRVLLTLH